MATKPYFKRFSKRHSFKVFRKTTRYKKYKLGITKVVRRWYMRKKRKTSIYMNAHPIYTWIRHYLKHRQFVRFTQSIGLNAIMGHCAISEFPIKNSSINGAPYGFHTYSCSYNILNKDVYFSNNLFNETVITKHSRNSYIQFIDTEAASFSNDLGTNNIFADSLCYPFKCDEPFNDSYESLLKGIDELVFEVTLQNVLEVRRTMILLTLISLKL